MSPRKKPVVTIETDERGGLVDRVELVTPPHREDRRVNYRARAVAADEDDPNRAVCGRAETVRRPGGRYVAVRCTRLVRRMGSRTAHVGVHYDRTEGLWYDRVYYPDGPLRSGTTGDHLR